jgi:hypothetical protein
MKQTIGRVGLGSPHQATVSGAGGEFTGAAVQTIILKENVL